ncbi:DUF4162 domain-containing protein [Brevibacillus formosus]|nr:DUF4162 domain-containing protein [Brevibacillus formosus]
MIAEGTPEQLKASVGGKTLTVRLTEHLNKERISRLLEEHLRLPIYPDQDNPHFFRIPVKEASLANQAIGLLLAHNVFIEHFSLSDPSLEEVFLVLTRGEKKEAFS